jgi:ammonia channel protein AmtB
MSFVILKLVDWTVRLRIGQQEEKIGLDLIEHRETGYTVLE